MFEDIQELKKGRDMQVPYTQDKSWRSVQRGGYRHIVLLDILQIIQQDEPRQEHTHPPAGRAERQHLWESGQARSQRTPGPKYRVRATPLTLMRPKP